MRDCVAMQTYGDDIYSIYYTVYTSIWPRNGRRADFRGRPHNVLCPPKNILASTLACRVPGPHKQGRMSLYIYIYI